MYTLFIMEFNDLECASTNDGVCQLLVVRQISKVGMEKGRWFSDSSKGYRLVECVPGLSRG
jgi:hypothetical protein